MPKPGSTTRRNTSLPKLIDKYYADLADLAKQNVFVEMGTRTAFFALLHAAGKEHGWTLIAEQEKKVGGKTICPDGTFKDEMYLVRGYSEAKGTADNLDDFMRASVLEVSWNPIVLASESAGADRGCCFPNLEIPY
jgi:hypothetical protein